jgi:hypothetical protein
MVLLRKLPAYPAAMPNVHVKMVVKIGVLATVKSPLVCSSPVSVCVPEMTVRFFPV